MTEIIEKVARAIAGKYGNWKKWLPQAQAAIATYEGELLAERDKYKKALEAATKEKDNAYWERNRLVAILARIYPSGRTLTNIDGWDEKWHNCIYLDTPRGQLSWHIHDDEMVQFASLPEYQGEWDGHSTEEKYRRLLLLLLDLEGKRDG